MAQKMVAVLIPEGMLQNAEHGRGFTQEACDAQLAEYVRNNSAVPVSRRHNFHSAQCWCGKINNVRLAHA